jgi:hypothetical protein
VLCGSSGVGFAVGLLGSFAAAGVIVAIVVANVGLTAHLRWDKARWVKRFPELAKPGVSWRRRYWL